MLLPKLEDGLVKVVKKTVKENKFWKNKNLDVMQDLINKVSNYYHIPEDKRPKVMISKNLLFNYGTYSLSKNLIKVNKVSLVTLMHEYRHFLQYYTLSNDVLNSLNLDQKEYDAQIWALSVFYNTAPEMFDNAWKNGKLMAPNYDGVVQLSEELAILF